MAEDSRTVLPLKDAYKFGSENGLSNEMEKIRTMEIEWDLSYTSTLRRGYVIDLLIKHNIFEKFRDEIWPEGNSAWGQSKTKFWLGVRQRYEQFLATGEQRVVENDLEEAEEQAFAAESDLRDFLAKNPECIEKGLRIYSGTNGSGVEFSIDGGKGRIDLLALDTKGKYVVIELKLGQGRNKTLGQLLYFMAWIDKAHPDLTACRGMIIAKDIPPDLQLAAKRVPGISLSSYSLSVTVSPVLQATM